MMAGGIPAPICHYRLDSAGAIQLEPQGPGPCLAWLREQPDGSVWLCVMEGGAFHIYPVSECGLGRLVAEGGAIFWRQAQRELQKVAGKSSDQGGDCAASAT